MATLSYIPFVLYLCVYRFLSGLRSYKIGHSLCTTLIDRSGIFRGAAHTIDLRHGWDRVRETVIGFATVSPSYYYEVAHVEFSDGYPLIAFFIVTSISIYLLIRQKTYRVWIGLIGIIVLFNVITLWLFSDTGGVGYASTRRGTGILASWYILLVMACHALRNIKLSHRYLSVRLLLFLLIPIHHLGAFLYQM